MQALQCVSQYRVANPHLSTHMATEHDNNHAAIPLRSATRDSRNAKNYAHRNNHSLQNTRGGTNSRMKRPQPHPPHTGGTFHRRLQPLYTEKHKVSCSGFLHKTSPMQHSCSHYNAFRSLTWLTRISLRTWQLSMTTIIQPFHGDPPMQRFKTRKELRTQEQPLVAEHRGGTDSRMKRPQPHLPHTRGTFHRRLQPLYMEKRKVSCSGFLPTQAPRNVHAAITMRFAASRG